MFEIESGIPVTPKGKGVSRASKYPWRDMQVGDSFFIASQDAKVVRAVRTAASLRRPGKFITRIVEGGIRVWRVA